MRPGTASFSNFIFVIGFALLIYLSLIFYSSTETISRMLFSIPFRQYVTMFLILIFAMLLKYLRWTYLLSLMKLPPHNTSSFIVFFSGFSMSVTPGKAGDFLKSFLMKEMQGTGHSQLVPIILVERLTDVLALSALILFFSPAVGSLNEKAGIFLMMVILIVMLMRSERLVNTILNLFLSRFLKSLKKSHSEQKLEELNKNLRTMLSPRTLFVASVIDGASWIVESTILYLILTSFGQIDFTQAVFIYSFSILAGALTFLPGGIGTSEASMATFLIMFGYDSKQAAAMTLLCRAMTLWLATLIGAIFLLIAFRTIKKQK